MVGVCWDAADHRVADAVRAHLGHLVIGAHLRAGDDLAVFAGADRRGGAVGRPPHDVRPLDRDRTAVGSRQRLPALQLDDPEPALPRLLDEVPVGRDPLRIEVLPGHDQPSAQRAEIRQLDLATEAGRCGPVGFRIHPK